MEKILAGHRRFLDEEYPARQELYSKLAKGQQPPTLLITCSDSRIEPHLVTGQEPGQLFVIRNAGNVVPPADQGEGGELATIEYAVSALKVKRAIVCGHSSCGAVTAALWPEDAASLPIVKRWVERMGVPKAESKDQVPARLGDAIQENVRRQLAVLRALPFVAAAREAGELELHGWVYDIGTGTIHACDAEGGAFRPLLEGDAA